MGVLPQALSQLFVHLGLQSRWLQKRMVRRIWCIVIFQDAIVSSVGFICKKPQNLMKFQDFSPEFCSISWQPCIVPKYRKPEIFSHNPGLNIIFYKKKYISTLCAKIWIFDRVANFSTIKVSKKLATMHFFEKC